MIILLSIHRLLSLTRLKKKEDKDSLVAMVLMEHYNAVLSYQWICLSDEVRQEFSRLECHYASLISLQVTLPAHEIYFRIRGQNLIITIQDPEVERLWKNPIFSSTQDLGRAGYGRTMLRRDTTLMRSSPTSSLNLSTTPTARSRRRFS